MTQLASPSPPAPDAAATIRWRSDTETPTSRAARWIAIALILVLAALPSFASRNLVQDLIFVFTMLALAQLWNVLAGWGGLVSVGQQAFVGLGAYALFAGIGLGDLDPLLAVLLAGVATGALAAVAGPLLFRLEGPYFAIGTWVVAESVRLLCAQIKSLGGGTGMTLSGTVYAQLPGLKAIQDVFAVRGPAARDIFLYWMALAAVIAITVAISAFVRSRHGLALAASRDNARAARSVGVRTERIRYMLWIVVAAATGIVGAIIYLQKSRISPDAAFSVTDWTAYVLFVVVIGGVRTIEGPIVGTLVLWGLLYFLSQFGSVYLLLLGLLAIVIMLFMPRGIWGAVARRWDLRLFPSQRRLSRVDDDENPAVSSNAPGRGSDR